MQLPHVHVSGDQPTQVVPRSAATGPVTSQARWPYVLIGLLAATVAGLGGVLLLRTSDDPAKPSQSSTATPRSTGEATPAPAAPVANANAYSASPVVPTRTLSPAGSWRGDWSSPSGAYLKFDLELSESGGGVQGRIHWTLIRTNRPDKQSKVGSTCIEYVRGGYTPETRQVAMSGYRKDDPNNMLVNLDQYRLNLSPDGSRLNGAARNGGKWNGRISLNR